jgi:hypothetical protein
MSLVLSPCERQSIPRSKIGEHSLMTVFELLIILTLIGSGWLLL